MTSWNWMMISPLVPEIFLSVVGLLLLMVGAIGGKKILMPASAAGSEAGCGTGCGCHGAPKKPTLSNGNSVFFFIISVVVFALLAAIAMSMQSLSLIGARPLDTLGGMLIVDGFSTGVQILLLIGLVAATLLSVSWLRENDVAKFEIPLLTLFSGVGMLLMVSANHLLSLYVSLELSSLCLYVLAAVRRDHLESTEAGLKYFILGALSSGLLLFGISLVYGFTGTLSYAGIADALGAVTAGSLPASVTTGTMVGMAFILAGLVFKISGVPFHMWTPDVYEGAPTPVTALFAMVPKIAAFALIIRLLVGPFVSLHDQYAQILVFVSVASMMVGAFAGLAQSNFKRLMAYSSIANMGYAMLGLLSGQPEGIAAILVYMAIYMVMTAGVFAVLAGLRRNGQPIEKISDFAGLGKVSPLLAYGLVILLFSMSGLPPVAGFFGKLFVFQAAVSGGYMVVAVLGVLSSVVASFYYLRVIKVMLFDEPVSAHPFDKTCSLTRDTVLILSVIFVIFFTFMPNALLGYAQMAAGSLFP